MRKMPKDKKINISIKHKDIAIYTPNDKEAKDVETSEPIIDEGTSEPIIDEGTTEELINNA